MTMRFSRISASLSAALIALCLFAGAERSVYAQSSPDSLFATDDFPRIARSDWSGTPLERLSPEEREKVKKNYERFKNLPPQERERIRENFKQWKQMPPEEKQKLRDRYEKMKPKDRPANPDRFRNEPQR